jgi:hypothetical protein
VYLAYVDDTASGNKSNLIAMFGAVIVFPDRFGHLETLHNTATQQLFPVAEIDRRFEEFHAYDLYNGEGKFEGIEKEKRYLAIKILLMALENLVFVYSAIDKTKLAGSALGSVNPVDLAFRMCLLGVEDWARSRHDHPYGVVTLNFNDLCLFIVDDTTEKVLKDQLRTSYRELRIARPYNLQQANRLWHAHDALYFGDSRDSVGIQLADLCAYFMRRHLTRVSDNEGFSDMVAKHSICARPEPEWTQIKNIALVHAAKTDEGASLG